MLDSGSTKSPPEVCELELAILPRLGLRGASSVSVAGRLDVDGARSGAPGSLGTQSTPARTQAWHGRSRSHWRFISFELQFLCLDRMGQYEPRACASDSAHMPTPPFVVCEPHPWRQWVCLFFCFQM